MSGRPSKRIRQSASGETEVRCAYCEGWKAPDSFSASHRYGKTDYQSYCRPCQAAYDRSLWQRKSRPRPTRVVAAVSVGSLLPCAKCGESKPTSAFSINSCKPNPAYKSWCKRCMADHEKRNSMLRTRTVTETQRKRKNRRQRAKYRREHAKKLSPYRQARLERKELAPILIATIRKRVRLRDAAELVGCQPQRIIEWQAGRRVPNPENFNRLSDVAVQMM